MIYTIYVNLAGIVGMQRMNIGDTGQFDSGVRLAIYTNYGKNYRNKEHYEFQINYLYQRIDD